MLVNRQKLYNFLKPRQNIRDSETDWINYFFANEDRVNSLHTKMKNKGYYTLPVENFYKSYACDLDWAKNLNYCTSGEDEYVGKYKTDFKPEKEFNVLKEGSDYKVELDGTKVKLKKVSSDKFEADYPGVTGTIEFSRNADNKVVGGKVAVTASALGLSKTYDGTFTKLNVSTSPSKPDDTKPEDSKYDFRPWKCINDWNRYWGFYPLLGGWDGVQKFAYEYTTDKVDGRRTKLVYYEDGTVVMRFQDDDTDVPGGKGKWSCATEGTGYQVKWENGEIAVFGKIQGEAMKTQGPASSSEGGSNTSSGTQSTTQSSSESKLPKFREACKSILPCPKKEDVKNNKAYYKICMKCPEIKEFQENPVLKIIYFKKLKENGLTEKTDGIFGPITKAAVEEYQTMNGLVKDGLIGPKTLAQLEKDKG